MVLNKQSFKTRSITAIGFVIVMVGGLVLNQWSFLLLFSVIHFGCWFEYQALVERIDPGYKERTSFHKYGVMIAGWCLLLWFCPASLSIGGLKLHEIGWWMGLIFTFVLPLTELLFTRNIIPKNIAHSFLGLIYISLSWGLLMDLYQHDFGIMKEAATSAPVTFEANSRPLLLTPWFLPAVIMATIWINDTMAYLVGSLVGKTPLTPISPKKTWEGTLGGIVLAIAVVGFVLANLNTGISGVNGELFDVAGYHWIFIAAIAAVAGTFGDLFESKLKRLAGVKDSGNFLPGHGGFLDRFDSMLVAIPFVWIYVKIFLG